MLSHQRQAGNYTKQYCMDLQYQGSDYSICFNPYCPLSFNRIFLTESDPLDHKSTCFKHILDSNGQIKIKEPGLKPPIKKNKEELLFESESIEAMIDFYKRSGSIRKEVEQIFDGLQTGLCQYINFCKVAKLKQLDELVVSVSAMMRMMTFAVGQLQSSSKITSKSLQKIQLTIQQELTHPLARNLPIYDWLIFDKDLLNGQSIEIKKMISKLTDNLITEKHMEGHIETVRCSDISKAKQFLCNGSDKQISKLKALCLWDESNLVIKTEFDFVLKCPICSFQDRLARSRENQLELRLKRVTNHLCCNHSPFLGYCYAQRIDPKEREEISFEEIVYLMGSQTFAELAIMDGTNGKCINLELNPSKLYINFTSKPHPPRGQSECRWLLVQSPEVAAYYTVLLIQEIAVKMKKSLRTINFKRNFINLYTKIIQHKQLTNLKIQEKTKVAPVKLADIKKMIQNSPNAFKFVG